MKRKYKIHYIEKLTKISTVVAEGEAEAVYKFDNNEDVDRETISSNREIVGIRYERSKNEIKDQKINRST